LFQMNRAVAVCWPALLGNLGIDLPHRFNP
jgi:hypothetical protein